MRVSTPYSIGLGFKIKNFPWIFTNYHNIKGYKEVVLSSPTQRDVLASVIYIDPLLDIAIIKLPSSVYLEGFDMSDRLNFDANEEVHILGLENLNVQAQKGLITQEAAPSESWDYFVHNIKMGTENSGGPILDKNLKVIGINNYSMMVKSNFSSLPIYALKEVFEELPALLEGEEEKIFVRCFNCRSFIDYYEHEKELTCPVCGERFDKIQEDEEEKSGIPMIIESMLRDAGYKISLARKGINCWEVYHGSAKIQLNYHEKSGMIMGDAFLCELPEVDKGEIYKYLLSENFKMERLTFSIHENMVVLSLILHDHALNHRGGLKYLKHLFQKADDYDNILIERFKAKWLDSL